MQARSTSLNSHSVFWRAKYARECIKRFQTQQDLEPILRGPNQFPLPPDRPPLHPIASPAPIITGDEAVKQPEDLSIGIIGAGPSGLYTAMILQDLGIKFEILEGSDRYGGRILTHHFDKNKQWNYFDVGAMRYPDIPIMWRVFDLFNKRLEIGNELIPYIMSSPNQILGYNAQRVSQRTVDQDPHIDYFNDSDGQGGVVPKHYVDEGPGYWLDQCFGPFKKIFKEQGWEDGFEKLMEYDRYSARMFMATKFNVEEDGFQLVKEEYPPSVINWLERMNTGTGLFDMAFSEMVLDDLEFDYPVNALQSLHDSGEQQKADGKWYCLKGGSQKFIEKMIFKIGHQSIQLNSRVMKVEPTARDKPLSITYQVKFQEESRDYDYVISTIPLSSLRYVNMDDCNLSYIQREGLRTLRYDSSCKVGIKFATRWWEHLSHPITGGQSKTDRVIRTAVFPSYGIHQKDDAVMIASYTWSQDALRVGGLCKGRDHPDERILINAILEDLAYLHDGVDFEYLKGQCQDWYAFDWYADPCTLGAFALFGPSQFRDIYPSFGQGAAGGRFFFAGEAISEQHAWVEGALDSAYEAVYKMLKGANLEDSLELLKKNWAKPEEYEDDAQFFETLMLKQASFGAILSSTNDANALHKISTKLQEAEKK